MNSYSLNPWILRCGHAQPECTLICLPYAGGSSAAFSPWRALLADTIALDLIQLPGRGARFSEPAFTHIDALVDQLFAHIQPSIAQPYFIYGHSMGGMIAFELIKRIHQNQLPLPQHLFLSATRPANALANETSSALTDAAFIEQLKLLNGTPQEILENQELMQLLLPMLRADFTLAEQYYSAVTMPIDCPVSVVYGVNDRRVPFELVQDWQAMFVAKPRFRAISGEHFFIETHQRDVVAYVQTVIDHYLQQNQQHFQAVY